MWRFCGECKDEIDGVQREHIANHLLDIALISLPERADLEETPETDIIEHPHVRLSQESADATNPYDKNQSRGTSLYQFASEQPLRFSVSESLHASQEYSSSSFPHVVPGNVEEVRWSPYQQPGQVTGYPTPESPYIRQQNATSALPQIIQEAVEGDKRSRHITTIDPSTRYEKLDQGK
jgi:hypothetical protein